MVLENQRGADYRVAQRARYSGSQSVLQNRAGNGRIPFAWRVVPKAHSTPLQQTTMGEQALNQHDAKDTTGIGEGVQAVPKEA